MRLKEILNFKKPYVWIGLVTIGVLGLAGVVNELDQKDGLTPPTEIVEDQVAVEEEAEPSEEAANEPVKTEGQIILERFQALQPEQIRKQAKRVGEEGWQDGIVLLAELPEHGIVMYGYNDGEYHFQGVAVDYNNGLSFFDWKYMSELQILPEMYFKEDERQLQITINLAKKEQFQAEELYVLMEYDHDTLEDYAFRPSDYRKELKDYYSGTGIFMGSYADIRLGDTMILKFQPVDKRTGEPILLEVHQVEIKLLPSKDGFYFELGNIELETEDTNEE